MRLRGVWLQEKLAADHSVRLSAERLQLGRLVGDQIDSAGPCQHSCETVKTMKRALLAMTRRSFFALSALVVPLLAGGSPAAADDIGYENAVTVSGEVLDLTCYLADGKKGSGHKACARLCAKKGLPMGLLTGDGEVFLLIENHDDPDPYDNLKKLAGTQVEVKAVKYSRDGMSSLMVLESKGL
jgi:hypothetical protein